MNRKMPYFMPFGIVPLSMALLELLDDTETLRMTPHIMGAVLLLISAMAGLFSPARGAVDHLMAAILPLSLFCSMFMAGFLDKNDLGTRFHLYRAVDVSLQPASLLLYLLMAVVTLGASCRCLRNIIKRLTKRKDPMC